MLTVGIVTGVIFSILCIVVGVLTSSVIALRCTHARRQTRKKKPEDVLYDEICRVGVNPLATQLTLKDNSAYCDTSTIEMVHKCEDEYVTMT